MKNWFYIFLSLAMLNGCANKEIDPPQPYDNSDITETASKKYSKYIVYHLGAQWCRPCQQMIKLVWKDKEVLRELERYDAKLMILDATKEKDKKYFAYYKVRSYPTILILERKDLTKHLVRQVGYISKRDVLLAIERYRRNL